ncbi:YiiX/YebB-like N1pC/P60 family cysteine hydrolase [Candidatus Laterigemmans baculatus]|uniref:YiiX/YebB-like N1pC/P60 family cysteine hydrolase n=1 Tax=Candidatus Laterigemmans baculatus TaxID=2770505 RepID=UPI0013DC11E6|nr:YiiX/YebB-like N1pC/P60 family cysteine hydrolase [Candidatus Laterigemmans baculatus]
MERWLFPKRVAWEQWGGANLQTGDLVFTRGNYYVLLGAINFSDFLSTVSASPFSHVGIVAIEDGQAMVYDISDAGLRSAPFAHYVTQSNFEQLAVRRPVPELYAALPEVIRFVREKQAEGVAFDRRFGLGNDALYCSELIVEAFAAGGVTVAEPVPAGELPGIGEVSPAMLELVQWTTGLALSDAVYSIGNETSGLYGSRWFVECLPPTEL